MDWQPIETLPEGQFALLWCRYGDSSPFVVDRYRWRVKSHDELVRETKDEKTYRVVETREREWGNDGWPASHWMPLPDPPVGEGSWSKTAPSVEKTS